MLHDIEFGNDFFRYEITGTKIKQTNWASKMKKKNFNFGHQKKKLSIVKKEHTDLGEIFANQNLIWD